MTRLRPAIAALNLPAIEKISEEQEGSAFQVLIATLLSAQTKDAVTLEASARLFEAAPDAAAVSRLSVARIERLIYPVSFYRNKARHVKAASRLLLDQFAGRVPTTMEELLTLPGVGRKTANLVLIVAHRSADNICVDTHVHRISNRLGWVETNTPEATEHALYGVSPKKWWADLNLYLVTWGQHVCRPLYPRCHDCVISSLCPRLGVGQVGKSRAQV